MGCIYMYINKINGKKYIGQTTRKLKIRHQQHLNQNESYFDKALKKYGESNFELVVLEDNINTIEQLNEKEKYYIEKYDTYNNGYNLTLGGFGTTKLSNESVNKIIDLLKNTKLTIEEIGNQCDCSMYTVSDINTGSAFYNKNENYPIRKSRCTQKYFDEDIKKVINLLKTTEYTYNQIASMTDTTFAFVQDVNRGKVKYDYKDELPIRKSKYELSHMTLELCLQIVEYLKKDLSAEQISNIVGVPAYTVGQINRGKMAICRKLNETFPIQKRPHRNRETAQQICATLSKEDVLEIVNLILNTTLSFEEIARRYNVTKPTIDRINRKATWKNLLGEYEAPIRTNPKNKK